MSLRRRLLILAVEVWLPIALVTFWWFKTEGTHSPFWPPLRKIAVSFQQTWIWTNGHFADRLSQDLYPSLLRFVEGFLLAIALGVSAGLVFGLLTTARRAATPTIDFSRSVPITALVSPFIVLFGIGNLMKVAFITFAAFFPILLNTIDGVRGVDPVQRELAQSYKIRGRDRIFRIVLPAASPQIFAGLRVALAVGLLVMAFGEMVAGTNGIGFFVIFTQNTFRITEMWTGIVLLGLIGYVVNLMFVLCERRILRWHRGWRASALEQGGGH